MAKLPYMQFYPLDWLGDTGGLSFASKATWIDLICIAWNEPNRGVYERPAQMFARDFGLIYCGQENCINPEKCTFHQVLKELAYVATVRFCNGIVRIESGRMVREETERKKNAKYQFDHRNKDKVMEKYENVRDKKLEVRSQKLDKEKDIKRKFVKPTAEELTAYGASIGYPLNAQYFLDHYEANGWRVGKVPMRDWKATVRKWKSNNLQNGTAAVPVRAAVLPKYKENVPPADEVMTVDDIRGLKAQIGVIDRTRAPA